MHNNRVHEPEQAQSSLNQGQVTQTAQTQLSSGAPTPAPKPGSATAFTQAQAEKIAKNFFSAPADATAISKPSTIDWAILNLGYKNPAHLPGSDAIFVIDVKGPQHMILNPRGSDQVPAQPTVGRAIVEAATGVVLFADM